MNEPITVADNLAQAHEALMRDLRHLETAARNSALPAPELRQTLTVVQEHVREHFRLEEENGYMTAVQSRQPQRERELEKLRTEHRALARSLADIIGAYCCSGGTATESLRARIRSWIKDMKHHEEHENHLVQDAFNLDIWAED